MSKEKSSFLEKKYDAEEMAKALSKLSSEDKTKIFYMVKGIELVNDSKKLMVPEGA